MTNPYPNRLTDLLDHLRRQFDVTDTDAATLLLAGRLQTGLAALPPLMCAETDWHGTDPSQFWGSFGLHTTDLETVRAMRPRSINACVTKYVMHERRKPPLFLEQLIDRPGRPLHRNAGRTWFMLQQSLVRVRTESPRTRIVTDADRLKLRQLAKAVLDDQFRLSLRQPAMMPQSWAARFSAMMRLNPALNAWDDVTNNFATMAALLPRLRGDDKLTKADWRCLDRLARDSVRKWTLDILDPIADRAGKGLASRDVGKAIVRPPVRVDTAAEWRDRTFVPREMKRLKQIAAIRYDSRLKRWTICDEAVLSLVQSGRV